MACLTAFLLCALIQSAASHAGVPAVVGKTQLSAQPAALSAGPAGPLNRIAYDIDGLPPKDPPLQVTCIYPGNFRYRCDAILSEPEAGSARRRVTVTIPDLGKGGRIMVRFSNALGAQDVAVTLANLSQVIHEIEALPLSRGGQTTTGGNGQPMANMGVVSERAISIPAIATSTLAAPPACDQVHAEWVNASATDPVFQSPFGPLNGSIILSRPAQPGSFVRPDNVPEWLISYPLSALRVQFIAHYEVIYRVGVCQNKVITG